MEKFLSILRLENTNRKSDIMDNNCNCDLHILGVRPETHADEVRTLLPLPRVRSRVPAAFPEGGRIIAIVDCEATSLNPSTARIIELAVMGVIVDRAGRIVGHTPVSSWLEDPGEHLSEEVKIVTRLDDTMLAGQRIDERAALGILNRAAMIVAHNASYDAPLIERRLPSLAGKAWACSVHELDWLRLGYDGAKLSHLVMQAGWYCNGHRAAVDVAALFHLLQVKGGIGGDIPRTHLERLLERADQPMVRVAAVRPGFGHGAKLKARGYRWDPDRKSWWTNVSEDEADREETLLRLEGIHAIDLTRQTACDRHRSPPRVLRHEEDGDEYPF